MNTGMSMTAPDYRLRIILEYICKSGLCGGLIGTKDCIIYPIVSNEENRLIGIFRYRLLTYFSCEILRSLALRKLYCHKVDSVLAFAENHVSVSVEESVLGRIVKVEAVELLKFCRRIRKLYAVLCLESFCRYGCGVVLAIIVKILYEFTVGILGTVGTC